MLLLLLLAGMAQAEPSPPPQFESGYSLPLTEQPPPRAAIMEYVDLSALMLAIVVAMLLAHRWRSRRGLLLLSMASLAYFGFYRDGCVCAIGAIQNFALGVVDPSYSMPLPMVGFLLLPLFSALVGGRVFCGAVCPLGAIQELVLLRPVSLPAWLEKPLHVLAYVYLSAAILFAATASMFVICRYDPFIGFFRLSGPLTMLVLGGLILLLSVFVGRPYCRFLCPLGVLLGHASRVSAYRVKISPTECIKCRLCEDACPYGAIHRPQAQPVRQPSRMGSMLAGALLLVPLLVAAGVYVGSRAGSMSSSVNPTVSLAHRIYLEQHGLASETNDQTEAFRKTGEKASQLFSRAEIIYVQFHKGGAILGGLLGLILGLKLMLGGLGRVGSDYQADRASCLGCGRCFDACPVDRALKDGKTLKHASTGLVKRSEVGQSANCNCIGASESQRSVK